MSTDDPPGPTADSREDDSDGDGDSAAGDGFGDGDSASRRTLIRLLVGLGLGVPIAIELTTFLGLMSDALLGGDADGEDGGTDTATPDPGVRVGEELLPETPPAETLADAQVRAESNAFVLTLTATVENTTEDPYRFRFGPVETGGGRTSDGDGNEVRVDPGGTQSVAGRWELPAGSTPRTLTVFTASGDAEPTERTVRLARIPVRGS